MAALWSGIAARDVDLLRAVGASSVSPVVFAM
jgi:hypothetical protein